MICLHKFIKLTDMHDLNVTRDSKLTLQRHAIKVTMQYMLLTPEADLVVGWTFCICLCHLCWLVGPSVSASVISAGWLDLLYLPLSSLHLSRAVWTIQPAAWLGGSVVERRSLPGELSLVCAPPVLQSCPRGVDR